MEITFCDIMTPVQLHSDIFYTTLRTTRLTLVVIETLEKLILSLKMAKLDFKLFPMTSKTFLRKKRIYHFL